MHVIITHRSHQQLNKHAAIIYLLFTQCSFDSYKNVRDCYRGEDCMKNFCKGLKAHVLKITNSERLKMPLLREKKNKSHGKQKLCYICRDKFNNKENIFWKVRDHWHYTEKYRGAI